MPERSEDWLRQARRDLEAAQRAFENEIFEWSCFISQQAVLQKLNAIAWRHSVFDLLRILSRRVEVSEEILDCAKSLDKYYVPTRYPNSFESGSPYEYFTRRDVENAIVCSRRIIEFCESVLA